MDLCGSRHQGHRSRFKPRGYAALPYPFAAEIEYPLPRSGALSQLFKG